MYSQWGKYHKSLVYMHRKLSGEQKRWHHHQMASVVPNMSIATKKLHLIIKKNYNIGLPRIDRVDLNYMQKF